MTKTAALVTSENENPEPLRSNLIYLGYEVILTDYTETAIRQTLLEYPCNIIIFHSESPAPTLSLMVKHSQQISPTPLLVLVKTAKDEFIQEVILAGASSFIVNNTDEHRLKPIISEDESYKLLRNMAMNKKMRISDLAKSLISASELLN